MVKLCLLDQKRLRMTNFGTLINCCAIFVFVFVFVSGATGPESRRRLHQGREDETAGQLWGTAGFLTNILQRRFIRSFIKANPQNPQNRELYWKQGAPATARDNNSIWGEAHGSSWAAGVLRSGGGGGGPLSAQLTQLNLHLPRCIARLCRWRQM